MHLNDLLDTVLVTRKHEPRTPPSPSSSKPGASAARATMNEAPTTSSGEAVCPVDHKTREIWLAQARAAGSAASDPREGPSLPKPDTPPPQATGTSSSSSWSPWTWFSSSSSTSPSTTASQQLSTAQTPKQPPDAHHLPDLSTTRTISSIPRSSTPGPSACPAPPATANPAPANHESETGADKATGNWIYPSEKMFFDAMRRKGLASSASAAADMKTVVPIHNAVNERAWAEIRAWEAPYTTGRRGGCADGPRLHSFAGVKDRMTPRARLNTLLGYAPPFDRHDWVVDRCGERVEYVIDFYAGRSDREGQGKLNFYLDVRPKINSWEGVKMRTLRALGLV